MQLVKDLDLDFVEWINQEGVAKDGVRPVRRTARNGTPT